jgi:hypothetical protein
MALNMIAYARFSCLYMYIYPDHHEQNIVGQVACISVVALVHHCSIVIKVVPVYNGIEVPAFILDPDIALIKTLKIKLIFLTKFQVLEVKI